MNGKKIQANMQINVGFVANTTELVKKIESQFKQINLGSSLFSGVSTGLEKNFKEIRANLEKMMSGLSKRGLSTKQYENIFNTLNDSIIRTTKNIEALGDELTKAFNSEKNKENLKTLKEQQKVLEEITKLSTSQKRASTRSNTNARKAKEEFGLDFDNKVTTDLLGNIIKRRANKQGLTPQQQRTIFGDFNEEQLKRIIVLYEQYNKQLKLSEDLTKEIQQKSGTNGSIDDAIKSVENRINKLDKETISQKELNEALKEFQSLLENLKSGVSILPGGFDKGMANAALEAEKMAKASSTIKEILAQFGIVFSAARIARMFKDLIKYSFDFYKSLDSALNQIYVVSNLSSEAVNNLTSNFINMAKETGMSIDDVTRAAVLFYQQGLNTEQVMTMTEVTAQFAKVAGIDATDAADKLTAAVNGYCLAAEDAMSVADKFNKVAAASAADINELSTAFSKAAAQANQAGVSMDNYLAYIATMEEATREAPENIGTSLKTIFSRMQQIKTGENDEDGVDVNQVETALRSVNVALRDTSGQLRDLEEIFDELGPKWQSLDRNTQAYLGTIIAGTRQQSRFITLMQNWDRVQDLAEQSANSAGQQALMHAKAMDSIESKMQQLTVAWQEFVSNLADSSFFKGLISLATKFLNLFNTGIKPVNLFAAAIALLGKKLKEVVGVLKNNIKDKFGDFKNFFSVFTANSGESAMSGLKEELNQIDSQIGILKQRLGDVEATDEQIEKTTERIGQLQTERIKKQNQLNQLEEISKNKWQAIAVSAGAVLTTIGMSISGLDENLSGIVTTIGTVVMTLAIMGTGPLGIVTAVISGIVQIFTLAKNWKQNVEKRITDSLENIKKGLEEVNNATTKIKSTNALIKKYEELDGKLYRTKEEQEELNKTIQEMADLYDLDIIEDAYGNLSINIGEVRKELKELNKEQQEALDKLKDIEKENIKKGISGLGNDTQLTEYLNKNLSQNSGQYKVLLNGLDSELISAAGDTGKAMAQTLSSNLKTELFNTIKKNPLNYLSKGFADSLIEMEDDINNAFSKNPEALDVLYDSITFLENEIDNMTFSQAQDYLDAYWNTWRDSLNITQDEWNSLVNSINNTVFKSSNISQYIEDVKTRQAKVDGSYYRANISDSKKRIREYQAIMDAEDANTTYRKTGRAHSSYGSVKVRSEAYKEAREAKQWEEKVLKEYKQLQQEYLNEYAKEHNMTREEAKRSLAAESMIVEALGSLQQKDLEYFDKIPDLYNTNNMKNVKDKEEYAKFIRDMMSTIPLGDSTSADKYNAMAKYYEENRSELSAGVREQCEKILQEAYSNLTVPVPKGLKNIGETLKAISEDLIDFNKIVEDFNSNGGIDIDTFIELGKLIDDINFSDLGKLNQEGTDYIGQYIQAIKDLNLAYDENIGYITMNGEALQSLQKLQEIQTKAKIASLIADLKASKATTETQLAYIDAQIEATQKALDTVSDLTEGEITAKEIQAKADDEYVQAFDEGMRQVQKDYEADVTNQGQWATTILSNIGKVADAWGKYFQGIREGSSSSLEELKKYAENVLNSPENKIKWEGAGSYSGIDWNKYSTIKAGSQEQKQLIADLTKYKEKLLNTRSTYQAVLDKTNLEINFLTDLYGKDLSKLGSSGKENAAKEIDKYIGQLKEIYNILNRIAMLEHRLSMLDSYADVATEKLYGDLLQERLSYNEELLDQYKFLTDERKKQTNGYKEFIQSVAGLEGVFDFDKYGQIIINYEKYLALQDEAIDGETTMKEKADDVYETYTKMLEEVQDYLSKTIDYYKAVINIGQEMVDSYVELQDKAADAVKEIYQKILDTKLDAIDQEKEAIEELRKARERANKEQKDAKEVAGIQSDIQRAMMDTSGASATSLIKAQSNLDDKLDAIAEDKYSEMLDNIIERLDETQKSLQQEFDDMFDDLTWLFTWLDSDIMNNYESLEGILVQTQAWRESSELTRMAEISDWKTKFETYYDKILDGSKGIYDIFDKVEQMRREIKNALDPGATNTLGARTAEIGQTILSWSNGKGSNVTVTNASAFGGGGGNGNVNNSNPNYNSSSTKGGQAGTYTKKSINAVNVTLNSDTKNGTFNQQDDYGVYYQPDNVNNDKLHKTGYTAGDYGIKTNTSGFDVHDQNLWYAEKTKRLYVWNGTKGVYELASALYDLQNNNKNVMVNANLVDKIRKNGWYKKGGFVYGTGPAWLDGTSTHPEAVLDALQTKHFIDFTNTLDKMYGQTGVTNSSSVTIDNISFNVESMSSPEDGEKAFAAFVNKFNEIGSQTGIKFNTFKNTL